MLKNIAKLSSSTKENDLKWVDLGIDWNSSFYGELIERCEIFHGLFSNCKSFNSDFPSKHDQRCMSLKEHDEEMRWLAELFPLEELVHGSIPDEFSNSVLGEWRAAHRDDARALRYLAVFRGDELLMEKSGMGDAWMMARVLFSCDSLCRGEISVGARIFRKGGCGWDLLSHAIFSCRNWLWKETRAWLKKLLERWIWEVILPFRYLVENCELESEKRTISLLSFVGLHVSVG